MQENQNKYSLNLETTFKYTEKIFDSTNKTIDNLNNRASAFLGFGSILLKFAFDLPSESLFAKTAKIITVICLGLSIIVNLISLLARGSGGVIKPKRIMEDDYFELENKDLKATIIDCFIKAAEELEKQAIKKGILLNVGIILIVISALTSATSIIIALIYK